jgi:RNA polymerase sigma-54 factor
MTYNVGLQAEMTQSLLITRQAIQSIEMLQYSQEELRSFLHGQAEKNPLIALPGCTIDPTVHAPEAPQPPETTKFSSATWHPSLAGHGYAPDLLSLEETYDQKPSLREHLHQQLSLSRLPALERTLAGHIIDSLDPDGYLRRNLSQLTDLIDASEETLRTALGAVQDLEPTGIGARNLAECLRLQLRENGTLTGQMEILLDNLQLIADGEVKKLAKLCGVSLEDIIAMVRTLRRLNPTPGRAFDWDPISPALPDVLVGFGPDDTVRVELNPEVLPRVLVDRDYYAELSTRKLGQQEKRFITDCLRDASFLVRNLDQRAKTILKISAEIARCQEGFFRYGVTHLRPLSQKAVAQTIGVHDSTVSRAIANKYVLCSRGLFSLKFFFSDGISGATGEDEVASETIRHRINALIALETPDQVLSDDAIVVKLRCEGIEIARRTVAKYRLEMNIPSSSVRRRKMRLQ